MIAGVEWHHSVFHVLEHVSQATLAAEAAAEAAFLAEWNSVMKRIPTSEIIDRLPHYNTSNPVHALVHARMLYDV